MSKTHLRIAFSSALMAFGASKVLAQLFLVGWGRLSAGQSDIAARGVWLLAMFMPWFIIVGVCVAAAFALLATRRAGLTLLERSVAAIVGACAGALVIFFGADPTVFLLRYLSNWFYYAASITVGAALFSWGLIALLRVRGTSPVAHAAA